MSSTNNNSGATQGAKDAGETLGDRVKGAFEAAGGAGDVLRGNINSFLDKAGESISGTDASKAEHRSRDYEEGGHESIAKEGEEAIKEGINKLKGGSS